MGRLSILHEKKRQSRIKDKDDLELAYEEQSTKPQNEEKQTRLLIVKGITEGLKKEEIATKYKINPASVNEYFEKLLAEEGLR
ncbi:MAG: hypothetical protein GOV15_03750 [Candidatus Diapherotrites archaeon]|nr:hypothetical protein [Candidatus Diapherotrites archaeon]